MTDAGSERPFDLAGLFRAVDAERRRQDLAWAALSREVGVAASTIRRCARADDMEADGVLALVRWLGVPPEDFVSATERPGVCLASQGPGMVRVAGDAMPPTAERDLEHRALAGQRTSIQRLTRTAIESDRSIASLTRWSAQ